MSGTDAWGTFTRTRREYGVLFDGSVAFIDVDLIDELLDCTGPFDRALVIYDRAAREALLARDIIEASVSGRVWPTESGRELLREMRDAVSERIREESGS